MVDASQWSEPLLFGSQPLYQDGVLYVFDRADHTLKAYRTPPMGREPNICGPPATRAVGPVSFPRHPNFCVSPAIQRTAVFG